MDMAQHKVRGGKGWSRVEEEHIGERMTKVR